MGENVLQYRGNPSCMHSTGYSDTAPSRRRYSTQQNPERRNQGLFGRGSDQGYEARNPKIYGI